MVTDSLLVIPVLVNQANVSWGHGNRRLGRIERTLKPSSSLIWIKHAVPAVKDHRREEDA
jgi:hypothetical protein